jgi:hypothetical protein
MKSSFFQYCFGNCRRLHRCSARASGSRRSSMIKSGGAISCLDPAPLGRVTISDLGPVQNRAG